MFGGVSLDGFQSLSSDYTVEISRNTTTSSPVTEDVFSSDFLIVAVVTLRV